MQVTKLEDEFLDPLLDHVFYVEAVKGVLQRRDQQQVASESCMEQVSEKRDDLKALEAQASKPESSVMFLSLKSSFVKMLDSNPEQTRKDNVAKLQTSIVQLEEEIEKTTSTLVKISEDVTVDVRNYEQMKSETPVFVFIF